MGNPALEYINRREVGQESNNRLFYGRQMGKIIIKYSRYMCRILSYIWRTHNATDPSPPYQLIYEQRERLVNMQQAIIVYEEQPNRESSGRLSAACLAWWISLADQQLGDNEYVNALVSGAAVLGWNGPSKVWKTPINYPPTLSAIITVYRMLVVHHAHQQREREIQ